MLSFMKTDPNQYVIHYSKGRKKKVGAGICFWYFKPTSTIVVVPVNSVDEPFIFEEVTADYQEVTVQGQVTYKIVDPAKAAEVLDFSLNNRGRYNSKDPEKPSKRLLNCVKVYLQEELQTQKLKDVLKGTEALTAVIGNRLKQSSTVENLGLELLDFNILALKANPETMRALEATIREEILKTADEARYDRRNASVEQERAIKENEFNTEIAVEKKQQEVQETKLAAKRKLQSQNFIVQNEKVAAEIDLEEKNKELVALQVENEKEKADSQAYSLNAMLKAYENMDPKKIQALAMAKMDSQQLIANAFNELAENAGKIGELNISPELLNQLMRKRGRA